MQRLTKLNDRQLAAQRRVADGTEPVTSRMSAAGADGVPGSRVSVSTWQFRWQRRSRPGRGRSALPEARKHENVNERCPALRVASAEYPPCPRCRRSCASITTAGRSRPNRFR
jgi:hypothetical protein